MFALILLAAGCASGPTTVTSERERTSVDPSVLFLVDTVPASTSASTVGISDQTTVLVVTPDGVASRATDGIVKWEADESEDAAKHDDAAAAEADGSSDDGESAADVSAQPARDELVRADMVDIVSPASTCIDATDAVTRTVRQTVRGDETGPVVLIVDAETPATTFVSALDATRSATGRDVFLAVVGDATLSDVLDQNTTSPAPLGERFIHVIGPLSAPTDGPELTIVMDSEIHAFDRVDAETAATIPMTEGPPTDLDWSDAYERAVDALSTSEHVGPVDATVSVSQGATVSDLVRLIDVLRETRSAEPDDESIPLTADNFAESTATGGLVERIALEGHCGSALIADGLLSTPAARKALLGDGAALGDGTLFDVENDDAERPHAIGGLGTSGPDAGEGVTGMGDIETMRPGGGGAGTGSGPIEGLQTANSSSNDESDASVPSDGDADITAQRPIVAHGEYDAAILERIARQHRGGLLECYRDAYGDLDSLPQRAFTARLVLNAKGAVEIVTFPTMPEGTDDLQACLKRRIEGWHFPAGADGGGADVVFPFEIRVE